MTKSFLKELLLEAFTQGAVVALADPNSTQESDKAQEWINNTMAKISEEELGDEGRFMVIKVSLDTNEVNNTIHVEKKVRKLNELELLAVKYKFLETLNK